MPKKEHAGDCRLLMIRNVVFVAASLVGLGALIHLSFVRFYNYDELSHIHNAWLVAVGQIPYRDFAANHFPFLWILFSSLMRILPENSVTILMLRELALALNLIFVAALGCLICAELSDKQRVWAIACLGLVVFSPSVMQLLIEFRPDALANALLFSTLVYLRFRKVKSGAAYFVSGFVIGAALLINTKYLMFPVILGATMLALNVRDLRRIAPFALTICAGFVVAILSGVLLLVCMRIPLDHTWQMVVAYNGAVEKMHTFGFGLVRGIQEYPELLAYSVLGFAGCVVLFGSQRRFPEPLAVGIFILLIFSLMTTTRIWRQYVVSWFLLATYFPARSLPVLITRLRPGAQVGAAGMILLTIGSFAMVRVEDPNAFGLDRSIQIRIMEWVWHQIPRDAFVVASFLHHPVFRKDTFFKTVDDGAPSFGGDGIEAIMPSLTQPAYAEHFQRSGYVKDLEDRPPSVLFLEGNYTPSQIQVLTDYMERHGNEFENGTIPETSVVVLWRKVQRPADVK